jgi:hypothetical protein
MRKNYAQVEWLHEIHEIWSDAGSFHTKIAVFDLASLTRNSHCFAIFISISQKMWMREGKMLAILTQNVSKL